MTKRTRTRLATGEGRDAAPRAGRTLVQDAEWAIQHLDRTDLKGQKCPSDRAKGLWQAGKKSPKILVDILVNEEKRTRDDAAELAIQRDCQRTDEELTELIERLLAAQPIEETAGEIMRTYSADQVRALINLLTSSVAGGERDAEGTRGSYFAPAIGKREPDPLPE